MTLEQISNSISYCGLICCLCSVDNSCDCKTNNSCNHDGCFQYDCCNEHQYAGCWECLDFPCDKDMLKKLRLRTFVKCIKEDGIENFSKYILKNSENGILYHRNGHIGDYDLDTEEEILLLLRTGRSSAE